MLYVKNKLFAAAFDTIAAYPRFLFGVPRPGQAGVAELVPDLGGNDKALIYASTGHRKP